MISRRRRRGRGGRRSPRGGSPARAARSATRTGSAARSQHPAGDEQPAPAQRHGDGDGRGEHDRDEAGADRRQARPGTASAGTSIAPIRPSPATICVRQAIDVPTPTRDRAPPRRARPAPGSGRTARRREQRRVAARDPAPTAASAAYVRPYRRRARARRRTRGRAAPPSATRRAGPIQPRFTASTKKKTIPSSVTTPPARRAPSRRAGRRPLDLRQREVAFGLALLRRRVQRRRRRPDRRRDGLRLRGSVRAGSGSARRLPRPQQRPQARGASSTSR